MKADRSADFQYLLLRAVVKLDKDANGNKITRMLEIFLGKRLNPGQIYTTLDRLSEENCLILHPSPNPNLHGSRQVKTYAATEDGLLWIEAYAERLRKLLAF